MNIITLSNGKLSNQLDNILVANKEVITSKIIPYLRENGNEKLADYIEYLLGENPVLLTHAGTMHADDVATAALWYLFNTGIEIKRVFSVPENFNGIAFDIGGGDFDHHTEPREARPNGVLYASFGKVWRTFAPIFFSEFVVEYVDEMLCSQIDHTDNTGEQNTLSMAVGLFNSTIVDDEDYNNDNAFDQAVAMVTPIIKRCITKALAEEQAAMVVAEAAEKAENKGILVLDTYVSWQYYLSKHPEYTFKVVIAPSDRGGYGVTVVPNSGFALPSEWWGNIDPANPPVPGIRFCHSSNGFHSAFDTLENAVNTVQMFL